jgi:putative lipoprotein (rSAM/lipoprotein system)
MRINYRPFIKGTNWALAGILTLLGFSRCGDKYGPDEYGTPWANYTIKGAVVDKATGKPIEGIQVNIVTNDEPMVMYGPPWTGYSPKEAVKPEDWTTLTNAKGEFELSNTPEWGQIPVAVTDIDGEKNGSFVPDTLAVDYENAKQTEKGQGWYRGEYTKTIKVELTEKKSNE